MASRKNTRRSTRKATQTAPNTQALWAEVDQFASDHPMDPILADNPWFALLAYTAHACEQNERKAQAQIDAAIQYLDASLAA